MARAVVHTDLPIVAAPMAGGPTTIALSRAVMGAGGFAFLAAGYRRADDLHEQLEQVRAHGDAFGVNLFVPRSVASPRIPAIGRDRLASYAAQLQPEADAYGLRLDLEPVEDDDDWAAKVAVLLEQPVPVVSLTFGLPPSDDIAALRASGSRVLATVTSLAEAERATAAGVDGLVVQGYAAGGHSAIHDPSQMPEGLPTVALVRQVVATAGGPVIAAGGVDGPDAVRALLEAGAEAVAVGTLLLRSDEAGTSDTHRAALADPAYPETVLTRAFTGRPARALRNGFVDRHEKHAPLGYPAVHHLTRALRQAAAGAGDPERVHLWAGTGFRSAPEGPAGEIVAWLAGE